jgi:outer membrane protein assembly factor BamD (BamD/ComL family)
MTTSKRFSKKQIKEDRLVTTAFKTSEYVQKNPTPFVAGGIALAVIIAAILLFIWNANRKQTEASDLLIRARLSMEAGQPEMAIPDLESLVRDYSGTDATGKGALLLASHYYVNQEYDKALQYFETIVSDYREDNIRLANAASGAATCHEFTGNFQEAARYHRISAEAFPDGIWAPEQMKKAMLDYLGAGDTSAAVVVAKDLDSLYQNTKEGLAAKRLLAELNY